MGWNPPADAKEVAKTPPPTNGWVPPADAQEVKKKDVAGSSTPSSTAQLPGFVQGQQLDLNAAPSSSPLIDQSPKLPNVVFNNNLYTGTKPTLRGAFAPTAGDVMNANTTTDVTISSGAGPYTFNWTPGIPSTSPASPSEATNTIIGQVDTQQFPRGYEEYAYMQRFNNIQKENEANKAAFIEANPGVPVNTTPQTPLEKAREFGEFYLMNKDPQMLSTMNQRIDYYKDGPTAQMGLIAIDIKDDDEKALDYQRAVVTRDQYALNLYNNGLMRTKEITEKKLEDQYGAQTLAFNEASEGMAAWPKGPDGQPIINNQDEANQFNTWRETVLNLSGNEGFMSNVGEVIKSENDLRGAWIAQQDIIRQNPLYYAEQDEIKAKEAATKARNELTGTTWVNENLYNPIVNATVDFALGISYLPKSLGDAETYGWTDALYEHDYFEAQSTIRPYTPQDNGLVANIVSAGTTMGLMIATGYALGTVGGGSHIAMMAGQATSGTVATMEGYYRAGIDAGMNEADAEKYSVVSGVIQGMLEMINPEAAFEGTLARRSAQAYAKALAEGATKKMAYREGFKIMGKNIIGEMGQEFGQQFSEWGVNMKANQITGSQLDTGNEWKSTLAETAVITTLLSAIVGGIQTGGVRSMQNKLAGETLYIVGSDPNKYRIHTAKMLERGEITAEKAALINTRIDEAVEVKSAIPSYMKPAEAVKIAPMVLEKVRLEQEKKNVDEAFQPDVERKIQANEELIQKEVGIKTEEQVKEESQIRVAEIDEMGDLQLHEQLGTIDKKEVTRLDELKKKYETPTPVVEEIVPAAEPAAIEPIATEVVAEESPTPIINETQVQEAGTEAEVLTPEAAAPVEEPAQPVVEVSQEDIVAPDNAIDDDAVVSKLDDDLKIIKTLSATSVGQKAKAVDQRIGKALKEGKITQETADKYNKAFNDVVTGRVNEIKAGASKKIDDATEKVLKFGKKVGMIGPNTIVIEGKEVPISKNSMLDLESLVKVSSDLLKRAVSRGIDVQVAFGNMKAAIVNHPRYKRLIASGEITPEDYDKLVMADYEKVAADIQKLQEEIDTKEHRAASYIQQAAKFLDPDMAAGVLSKGTSYIPQSMSIQASDAKKFVEMHVIEGNLDGLKKDLTNLSNGMQPDVRTMISAKLMERYIEEANGMEEAEKKATMRKAGEVLADALKVGEIAGRTVNNMKEIKKVLLDQAGPEGAVMVLSKDFQDMADAAAENERGKIRSLVDQVNKEFTGKQITFDEIDAKVKNTFGDLSESGKKELTDKLLKDFNESGKLSKEQVRKDYADFLFNQEFSEEKQKYLKGQAEITSKYRKEEAGFDDKMKSLRDDYTQEIVGKTPSEIRKLTKDYEKKIHQAALDLQKSRFDAEKAHEKISKELLGPRDIWKTFQWGVKFGFLGVHSTAVNFASNMFMALPRLAVGSGGTVYDIITTPMWKAYGKLKGWDEVTRSHNIFSQIYGFRYGQRYGAKEAWHRIWSGTPDVESMDKYEVHANIRVADAFVDIFKSKKAGVTTARDIENRIAAAYEATFGVHHVPIARLMGAGDAFPREAAKLAKLYEIARTQKGLKESSEITDFLFNPDEVSKKSAEDWARKLVYQQETGLEGDLVKKFNDLTKSIETVIIKSGTDKETGKVSEVSRHLAGMIGLLRTTAFPFMKTITNMLPEFVYLTMPGVGFASSIVKSKQAANLYTKASDMDTSTAQGRAAADKMKAEALNKRNEAATAFGRGMVAFMISSVAIALFRKGLLTGKASDDEDERNMEYMNIKPYSVNYSALERALMGDSDWYIVKDTDQWKTYDQLGTIGMAFGAHATMLKERGYLPGQEASVGIMDAMFSAAPEIVSKAMDMSFTKGTSALLQAMTEGGNKAQRFVANTLYGLTTVVLPNDVAAWNKSRDEFMRETKPGQEASGVDIYINRMKEATGSGEELPAKVDFFGNKVNRVPTGIDPMFYLFVSPTKGYTVEPMSAGYQIYDTWRNLPDGKAKKDIVPSTVDWNLSVKTGRTSQNVPLTGKEHEELQIAIGKEREARAKDYVFSDDWAKDSPEERAEYLAKIWDKGAEIGKRDFIYNNERMQRIKSGVPVDQSFEQ